MAEPPDPDSASIGITITRVFAAPRERVWKEWTEPERFADRFGGSQSEASWLSGARPTVTADEFSPLRSS
jgi:uncharacterized protein YndB with AHSA1/START domain